MKATLEKRSWEVTSQTTLKNLKMIQKGNAQKYFVFFIKVKLNYYMNSTKKHKRVLKSQERPQTPGQTPSNQKYLKKSFLEDVRACAQGIPCIRDCLNWWAYMYMTVVTTQHVYTQKYQKEKKRGNINGSNEKGKDSNDCKY
jgi:hypothetical protein